MWIPHKYEKNNFLYPVKALSRIFRGKFISGLEDAFFRGDLNFPANLNHLGNLPQFKGWLREIVTHDWVVYAKRPFSSPENVVSYVGMYTHRIVISNNRIISCEDCVVYEGIPCPKCGTGVLRPFVIMDGCGNILNGDAQEFIEIRSERQHSFCREIVEVMDPSSLDSHQ